MTFIQRLRFSAHYQGIYARLTADDIEQTTHHNHLTLQVEFRTAADLLERAEALIKRIGAGDPVASAWLEELT